MAVFSIKSPLLYQLSYALELLRDRPVDRTRVRNATPGRAATGCEAASGVAQVDDRGAEFIRFASPRKPGRSIISELVLGRSGSKQAGDGCGIHGPDHATVGDQRGD
jgi:hypothetical protein